MLEPGEIAGENADERVRILPGQRSLGFSGQHQQVGLFDGLGYSLPDRIEDPDAALPDGRLNPAQLAFVFEREAVQMGFHEWHQRRDAALTWLAGKYPRGKTRRALRRRAERGGECGRYVRQRVCRAGHEEAKTHVASRCESRTCPASARADALELRSKLLVATRKWPVKRRGLTWFMHTITVRRPEFTSIERLKVDRKRALAGWRAIWPLLRKFAGAKRAQLRVEVSPGGMVHVHVLAHHRYLRPNHLQVVRAALLEAIGGGTSQYKVDRIGTGKGTKGGIKEVAKYLTKGVAMNNRYATQTHPVLSAMVETAYLRLHIGIEYGDWKGIDAEREEPEWKCPCCGINDYVWRYLDTRTGEMADREASERGPP